MWKCETVEGCKTAKHQDIEDTLIIWIGQVNVKNGTAADEVTKKQVKVNAQQMGVTNVE
jgi:hypothetical protein